MIFKDYYGKGKVNLIREKFFIMSIWRIVLIGVKKKGN